MLGPISRIDKNITPKHSEVEYHDDDEIHHRMFLECIETHPYYESQIEYEK
jgi:hypothetical protein